MPSKNREKRYILNGYYHIYNRGVNKCEIFKDSVDMVVFEKRLRRFSMAHDTKISICAYTLMKTHFHLLVRNLRVRGIETFMRSIATSYVMYFNKRHLRVGNLFQDRYKGRLIASDGDLLNISRYIHLNPYIDEDRPLEEPYYPFSSLEKYITGKGPSFINTAPIMDYFPKGKAQKHYFEYLAS